MLRDWRGWVVCIVKLTQSTGEYNQKGSGNNLPVEPLPFSQSVQISGRFADFPAGVAGGTHLRAFLKYSVASQCSETRGDGLMLQSHGCSETGGDGLFYSLMNTENR